MKIFYNKDSHTDEQIKNLRLTTIICKYKMNQVWNNKKHNKYQI